MIARFLLPAILTLTLQGQGTGPSYSSSGLVNGASLTPAPLAPNTWMTLYGANLSYNSASLSPQDLPDGQYPIEIPGTGVRVLFSGGSPAHLSYVSPTEIRFLTPASHSPGPTTLTVVRNGVMGPTITAGFAEVSPNLYQDNGWVLATHPDGSTITEDAPAHPGEAVLLFATGLGQTAVPMDSQSDGRVVISIDTTAERIAHFADLAVTTDDIPLDPRRISWAGLTPNFAGIYQIGLQLPDDVGPNPQIRVWIGDQASPVDVHLAVQP